MRKWLFGDPQTSLEQAKETKRQEIEHELQAAMAEPAPEANQDTAQPQSTAAAGSAAAKPLLPESVYASSGEHGRVGGIVKTVGNAPVKAPQKLTKEVRRLHTSWQFSP